jgi:flagellar basal-body rod protein FlgG
MNNAVYAATTGMLNRAKVLDATANNLANAGTAGFKRDQLITSTFNEQVLYRLEGSERNMVEIGADNHGAIMDELHTDASQGQLESTGRYLDFAIRGDGFFSVEDGAGAAGLTRNGSFHVRDDGFLVTASGEYVLGQRGRMQVGAGDITINEAGEVSAGGNYVDTLALVIPQDPNVLVKQADGTLNNPGGINAAGVRGVVMQGYLERSNVDMIEEMTAMMAASRAFQSCGQALRILDGIDQKTVNEIGRA